jgi:O-antigen ligase
MSSLSFTTATSVTPGTRVVPSEMDTARYETGEVSAAKYPRAIAISFGALLLLAPLPFGGVQPWAWGAIGVIAAALLVAWATHIVRSRQVTVLVSPLYLPALLFFGLGMFQLLSHRSLDPFSTRESLLKLGADLVLFFLAGQLWSQAGSSGAAAAHKDRQATPGSRIALYAFGLAVFAILQLFSSNGLLYWTVRPRWGGWIFGPYVNHNHYTGLMEMLIPISAAWAISATSGTFAGSRRGASIGRSRRALLAFLVLVPIASVLLSGSRGGCIALLAEAGILAAILLRRTADIHRRRTASGALLVLAASLLCFFLLDPGGLTGRLASAASLGQASDTTLGDRLTVARDSLGIIRDHPWLGTGLGSFEVVYPGYRSFPTDLVWDHAHNEYLEAIAETGLTGAVLIAAALVLFFALAFRRLDERLRTPRGWIELGAALGCVGLLIHSLSDFNLHIPANAAWFAVCAAVATSHRNW